MAAPNRLPDPTWDEADAICLACGYSLAGIPLPARCPECSQLHGSRQFIICGVPSARSIMSSGRVFLWILASLGVFISIQGLGFALATRLLLPCGAVFLLSFVGMILLITTARNTKGGSSRFVIADGRISTIPNQRSAQHPKPEQLTVPTLTLLPTDRLQIKRISPVWANLTIQRSAQGTVFRAGVRLPADATSILEDAFRNNIALANQPPSPPLPLSHNPPRQ
jgi:hypothetical protein